MAIRVLAGAAAGWLSLYLLAYVGVVVRQGGEVALWYVVLGSVAILACVAAAAGVAPSTTTTTALVLAAAVMLAGVLTIGLGALPAVLALVVARIMLARSPRRPRTATQSTPHAAPH